MYRSTRLIVSTVLLAGVIGFGTPTDSQAAYIKMELNSVGTAVATDPALLVFNGNNDTFTFQDASGVGLGAGFDFVVNQVSSDPFLPPPNLGTGAAEGLFGNIGGTYTIGTISSAGPFQIAPVTGSGAFSIRDALGVQLTADVFFNTITTTTLDGTAGSVQAVGQLNLTNIQYTGTNTDLITLRNLQPGSITISFNFNPGKSLTDLTADGITTTTAYDADLYAVRPENVIPAPAGVILALTAFPALGLGALVRRRKTAA